MDDEPVSEVLPGLYRSLLDVVADIEAAKRRPEAAGIRAEATRVYSRAWNADAAKRLRALRARADRIVGAPSRPRRVVVVEKLGHAPDLGRRTA